MKDRNIIFQEKHSGILWPNIVIGMLIIKNGLTLVTQKYIPTLQSVYSRYVLKSMKNMNNIDR